MATELLAEFRALVSAHTHRHVDAWKAADKPVVGYFCPYAPPEVILATGALPLRLRGAGSDDSSAGDAVMSGRVCTYVRHVVSLAIEERYDFLDGVICLNTCDHVRRAADALKKKTDIRFHGFISVPRSPRESMLGYYRDELATLHAGMAEAFGVDATDDALRAAIATLNANRRRLQALNALRLEARPKLSGADSLAVHIASQTLPPDVFADLADRLLEALRERPGLESERGRLMLVGAELDEPGYVDAIESQGALVVSDRLCFGARSVLDPIAEDAADPLDAIARAYLCRPSCARMLGDFPQRWDAMQAQAAAAEVDGIVFERLLFCDPWGADIHNIQHRTRAGDGLPVLSLSREYGVVPTGQVRTRVQAFLEKLEVARAQQQRRAAGGTR